MCRCIFVFDGVQQLMYYINISMINTLMYTTYTTDQPINVYNQSSMYTTDQCIQRNDVYNHTKEYSHLFEVYKVLYTTKQVLYNQ